ncbi:hypothetical protein NQ317_018868 [Molorchus minor]|uniref:THAP-type domain-containing protein n=1 Tax=Molorchus minor TaxID=1323400 RepID=A0ABQ9JES4_9CUCU|nr:hypothetical protein NQ317_018868 [Molorchus minor]
MNLPEKKTTEELVLEYFSLGLVPKKKNYYKYCIVPQCKNTSTNAPEKLFISLPSDIKLRRAWQRAMRRTDLVSDKGTRFCCQDHFNVEEDIENYIYIKIMKCEQIKLKPGVIPHIFDCQKKRSTLHTSKPRPLTQKKEQKAMIKELLCDNLENEDNKEEESKIQERTSIDRGVQVNLKPPRKSRAVQCAISNLHETACKKRKSNGTEKIDNKRQKKDKPSQFEPKQGTSMDLDLLVSTSGCTTSSSSAFTISDNNSTQDFVQIWNTKDYVQKRATYLIEKDPKLYLGIPSHSLFIIEMLSQKCKISKLDIFITLKKIKLDVSYRILADDFCLSLTKVCSVVQNCIPLLAKFLKPFIQWKTLSEVQKGLPIPFRHRYRNVQCIIDCFEISIQKSTNPIQQSFSWSQYKGSNTIKYLIGCTPDGLISFISSGFGGRITDKMIVEESGFLNLVENGTQIMADRGFKHLEVQLAAKNAQLVRPPSVLSAQKSSKEEVKQAKRIASLRIHIERVISRVREFRLLQPHARIHLQLVKCIDLIVQIVCGIINIQDFLIK